MRVRGYKVVGVDPNIMGIGPVPAIRGRSRRAGLGLDDIDRFEINEAFAAQYLACERELGLDRSKVNVYGSGIALGHPVGATGCRLLVTLFHEMVADEPPARRRIPLCRRWNGLCRGPGARCSASVSPSVNFGS